jgi:hypothetical protein
MNDNIKKFVQECFDISIDGRGREECTADYINVQRFADLIIRECADVADTLHLYLPSMTAKKLIARHFGVEP